MTDEAQSRSHLSVIPARAIYDRAVGPRMLHCLAVLCAHTNRRGECWPSRQRIATLMGRDLSETAVTNLLRRLASAGYIEILPRYEETGRQKSNAYRVRYDGDLPAARDRYPQEDRIPTAPAIERANREQDKAATNQPQRSAPAPTARRPGRRAEPDAAGVPDSADVTPAPAGLVYPAPRSGDAGAEPTADILTPDGWLTPDEQQRRERANLAELGLTADDAEEYRANPRDWRAAQGIKPRPGAGHTRPAAQPGRTPTRR